MKRNLYCPIMKFHSTPCVLSQVPFQLPCLLLGVISTISTSRSPTLHSHNTCQISLGGSPGFTFGRCAYMRVLSHMLSDGFSSRTSSCHFFTSPASNGCFLLSIQVLHKCSADKIRFKQKKNEPDAKRLATLSAIWPN